VAITRMGGPCANGVIGDITGPCVHSRGRARSNSEHSDWSRGLSAWAMGHTTLLGIESYRA